MWFKQVTCDNCFTPLKNTGRHNCYILLRVRGHKVITSDTSFRSYLPYQQLYPFPFATFNQTKPYGNIYMYSVAQEDLTLNVKTWFCDNECAYEYAKQKNYLMLYYDETLNSVRAITPHLAQINAELNNTPLRGLTFPWNREWIISHNKYKNLEMYNKHVSFPKLPINFLSLDLCSLNDASTYLDMLKDDSFRKSFWGTTEVPIRTETQIKEHIASMNVAYGRRLGLEWVIKHDLYAIGFIRMYCTNPSDPYNWYVEFGIKKEYQNRGYMGHVLSCVLDWARVNGLDKVYAICETSNTPCQKLLKGVPYSTSSSTIHAHDTYAGGRDMFRYEICL